MEPLFRLILVRPAVTQDPANPSINTAQDSPLQKALAQVSTEVTTVTTTQPRSAYQRLARSFAGASTDFIGDPAADPLNAQLAALAGALDPLEGAASVTHADVVKAVQTTFGHPPSVDDRHKPFHHSCQCACSFLGIVPRQLDDNSSKAGPEPGHGEVQLVAYPVGRTEYSDTQALHAHFCLNFQPIYQ